MSEIDEPFARELSRTSYDAIYVSPHLDDVAFSAPAAGLERRARSEELLEVVVFSRPDEESPREVRCEYEQRRNEERRAAEAGGWDVHFAGFVDAPFRPHPHRDANAIVWGTSPDDAELVDRIGEHLGRVADEFRPDEVVGPLGVGRHVDHRLTHRAVRRFDDGSETNVWYYEDRPYALVPEAVGLRLGELGVPVEVDLERFFEGFWAASYVENHWTEEREREVCRHHYEELAARFPDPLSEDHPASATGRRAGVTPRTIEREPDESLWAIPFAHESQIEPFLGSRAAFRESCRAYAERNGASASYLERQWRLERVRDEQRRS